MPDLTSLQPNAPPPDENGVQAPPPDATTTPAPMPGGPSAAPQPAAPPKESVMGGIKRGAHGETYMVDGQGNMVSARTTAPSPKGEFGSILGGIVMGALAGASKARPGGIPSAEIGGGAGAGVGAAVEVAQQRDTRNRGQAEQNFANQEQVQKMSREQAESAAQINHLAADTARITQEATFANEDHPLHVAALKAGLSESSQKLQEGAQRILSNTMDLYKNLGEAGIPPQAIVTNWSDAKGHASDIVQGKILPLHNGEDGADAGVGMFDVGMLKNTPMMKPVTYKTYTSDKDGNPVEQNNTLPAGKSAFDYVMASMAGVGQLTKIQSQQKIKMAVDLNKAEVKEKNASANEKNANAWAVTHPGMIQGMNGGQGAQTDAMKAQIAALPPDKQAILKQFDANTQASLMSFMNSPGDLDFKKIFGTSPRPKTGQIGAATAEGVLSQLMPGWSMHEYEQLGAAYKAATTGKEGAASEQYGNVIQHMAAAQDVLEKNKRDTPEFMNVARNKLQNSGYGTQAKEIESALIPVKNEFSLLMTGGYSPKTDETKAYDAILNEASTPAQLEAAFKVFGNTGTIRLENVNNTYKRSSRGRNLPGLISQETRDAAKHLNLDPEAQARLDKLNIGGTLFGSPNQSSQSDAAKPAASAATLTKGTLIQIGTKQYSYNGTGDQADIKNYTAVGAQ